jgi:hypothetical protein
MIFISILCTLLNSTSYYVFFFGFALYPSPPGLIYTLITLLSFSYSPLDVEKEGRSRAWLARFSSPPFLRLFFFLLLPSRRRKGGEVPRVIRRTSFDSRCLLARWEFTAPLQLSFIKIWVWCGIIMVAAKRTARELPRLLT